MMGSEDKFALRKGDLQCHKKFLVLLAFLNFLLEYRSNGENILVDLKRPPRKNVTQMTGQSHLDNYC
jgi:hypothetical protein